MPEDIINSFIFKADLSKLISSELSSRQTIEAPITEDKLYPLNILNQSIEKAPTLEEFHPVDSFIYKPDLIKPIEEAPIIKEINKVVLIKNDEIKPIIEVKNSNTSINNNKENSSKIMIAAAVLAIIVSYSIIKKKD